MQLQYISIGALIGEAGGDPWAINQSLQEGRPAQIADLADAFHAAGRCTAESSSAFGEARRQFEASWNRENGEHPINDSAEVQRVTKSLGTQSLQLPKIAVDLENIAAALSEAQRSGAVLISTLEGQLQQLDNEIGYGLELEKDPRLSAAQRTALDEQISGLQQQAVDDTKSALGQLESLRNGYSDFLRKSLATLHADGYDQPLLAQADADTRIPPPSANPDDVPTLANLDHANDQAVIEAMKRVKAAQKALDEASAAAYAHGAGSPEAQDAQARLPQLKRNLADALDDLGKVPDYSGIDPKSVQISPDGHLMFDYTLNGQTMQVTGGLKNGSGELFDQGSKAYYTYKDGKLIGTRFLDEGRAIPNDELLQNAVFTAVGAGPTLTAAKAGAEVAWQGMRALFTREALETGTGAAAGVTADNVLPRAVVQAEARAEAAANDLAGHAPIHHTPAVPPAEHPAPIPSAEHPAPPITHDHPLPAGGPHESPLPADHAPHPLPPDPVASGPAFTLDNPLDHMTPELRALSEQHLTDSGETVLGPFNPANGGPSYIQVAKDHGASYFDIGDAWNGASPTERLAANQHVLDMAITNRDNITLSVPFGKIDPNSYTGAEIRYLESHGYARVGSNTLVPPTGGKPS